MASTIDGPDDLRSVLPVSRETVERLETYRTLLDRWQRKTNLVGASTLDTFWSRHVVDAAFVYRTAPEARLWLDVGSGAGLPGLAIAAFLTETREEASVVSMDSNARKCAFQRMAVMSMGLRNGAVAVEIVHSRVEDFVGSGSPQVLTARAFAPLVRILQHVQALRHLPARLLLLKGESHEEEVRVAREAYTFDLRTLAHPTTPHSVLLDIRAIAPRIIA